MGKHNLRRIVNLQKWEKSVTGIPATEKQGGLYSGVTNPVEGTNNSSLSIPLCLSPATLKRDLEQLEQLKYRKLK